jgi:hypothetical protein
MRRSNNYGGRSMKERFRPIWQVFLAVMLLLSLGLVIAIHTSTPVLAATITSTSSGGAWTSNSTWVGGVVPGATDKVVIASGATVTIASDSTATCGDLNVIGTLSMNGPSDHPANIHVYGGGTSPVTTGAISGTGTITNSAGSSGGANVQFYGDWTFNGTMSGYVSFYFEGSQDQDTAGGKVVFPRNLFIQKGGGTVYFPVTPTWGQYFHIEGTSTVCYNGGAQNVAVPESTTYHYYNLRLAGSGSKTISTSAIVVDGTLSMEGTATASAAPTYGSSATLRYNTATARTTGPEWITPFAATGGVIIGNTGTITLQNAKVFGTSVPLTINSGATLSTSGSNYALTFGGNFVNNGGTFTAGSSPIVIANTMATQSIASFTTTGTVSMTKTSGTATFTGNVNGGALTINGAGGTLNLGSGLTHTFTGTWTRTAGTLAGNSSTLNLGGGLSGTGGTFTAGTGTVNYYGAAQTIAAVTYNNLIINQSSGSASLNGDVTVNGVLTLTNGGITTGSNKVIITANGSVSGGSTSSHIIGNLQKNVATGSSVSRTFEVGTASGYDPIVVNFGSVSVAGNLIANATAGEHPDIGTSAIDSSEDVNVYWSFTNSGITFTSYNATFNFVAGDIDGGADTDDFIVGKYDADWTYPTIGTKTSTSTQATGVTSLSDFVLGEGAAPTFTETFSTNSTFTVPAGVYQITVEGWAGGGGGGGRSTSGSGGAGGGGGGAYARATINVTPGEIYNVIVGGGGAGGPEGNNAGSAGPDSYFYKTGEANLTLAKGGAGGGGGAGGVGGTGGLAGSCVGDVKFSGGNGAAGTSISPYRSGGGGGGAGNQTAGGNASGTTGGTGGDYGGGAGGAGRTSNGDGSAGSELGGGGSGAYEYYGSAAAGGSGAGGEVRITYKPAPDAPALYPENDVQIAFNNIRQNTTTPTFRVSATHTGNFTSFKLELNTAPDFTGTACTQTFSGNYSPGTQYNLLADTLSPSLPTTNNATYYVRFRASADAGAHWSEWSTVNYPVWTFTYKSADELPDWFQTTDAQFGTGNLTSVQTDSPNNRVRLSGSWQQQILNVSGGGTFQVPAMVTEITVEAWGAGGAGGGRTSDGYAGGGGGGAYAKKTFTGLTPGSNISYYVAPTTTGTTGSGAAGNASWFRSNNSSGLVAAGGSGGTTGGSGGAGGSTASSYGDVEYAGGTGGTATGSISGGGGGGAGSGGAGGSASGGTAGTGTAEFGGTGGAGRSGTEGAGRPGLVYGGGGGGAYRTGSNSLSGGAGAEGLIRVTWWQPAAEGTIVSPAIEFDWVTGAGNWGEVQVNATTATNNSITVQVLNAVGSAISGKNVTIQNGGTYGEIDLSDLTTTGNNSALYLRATLTNSGGGTPYLNDWMVTWVTAAPEPSTITVTAPSAIAFDTLVWGDNTKSSATNGTVTVVFGSGSPTGWQVTALDLTNGGYMKSSNATLANMLQISGNGTTWANADDGITYNGAAAGNYTLPFWARQVINTNEAVGAYNITIVFTGEIVN